MLLLLWQYIQAIHKRMMRFQELTRNLFLTLHGHNVYRQQRQLSLSCATSSSLLMLTAGPVSKMASQPEKTFCVLRFVCDYSAACSAVDGLEKMHAWETWTVAATDGVRCARVRWEINFLLTFETAPFFCVYSLSLSIYIYIICMCVFFVTLVVAEAREATCLDGVCTGRGGWGGLECSSQGVRTLLVLSVAYSPQHTTCSMVGFWIWFVRSVSSIVFLPCLSKNLKCREL